MNKTHPIFRGQMPILPTTVDGFGAIDLKSQEKLVDYCLQNGVAAIGHLGGASEYHKVSQTQREQLIATMVEHVNGRVPVFVGTTGLSLCESIENAKTAERLGAGLLMVCSPIYGSMRADDLFDYYRKVSACVPLPIIVQDTGASSGVYTVDFILKLRDEIPAIRYAKAEGANFLRKTRDLIDRADGSLQVIGGAGGFHMIQLLRQGVTAFMTGTEASEIHTDVIRRYLEGDVDGAIDAYYTRLLPYLQLFGMNSLYMLKYMLYKRGIIENPAVLFPNDSPQPDKLLLSEFEFIWRRIAENRIKTE